MPIGTATWDEIFVIRGPATVKFTFTKTGDTYNVMYASGRPGIADAYLAQYPILAIRKGNVPYRDVVSDPYSMFKFNDPDNPYKMVVLPQTVTSDSVASLVNNLKSVQIGQNVLTLGDGTFSGCDTLTTVTLPYTLAYINANAFNGCSGLTDIHVGTGLIQIGNDAFGGCTRL